MNISISIAQLNESLDLVTRFVSKHATLPILENIYLQASIDKLILKGTDMEKHIEMSIPAKINQDGAITINAKTFSNIMKSIDGDEVELIVQQNDETLTIKTVKDNFVIKGIGANEYVALPEVQGEVEVKVDAQTLITWIQKIEYTVSDKNFSPVLTGIYMRTVSEGSKQYLVFAGSDSFRLAEYRVPLLSKHPNIKVILPKNNIVDIQKVFEYYSSNGGEEVTIRFSDNMLAFICHIKGGQEIMATSLLIQGNFPDYNNESIIPTQYTTTLTVDRGELEKAVRKILILTRDINNYILLGTKNNAVTIQSGSTDKWEANTSIAAITQGDELQVGINGKYISDFLKQAQGDEVIINLIDNQKPLVFKDPLNENYIYVARPLLK
jgi:DNA polymerase III subunit beta